MRKIILGLFIILFCFSIGIAGLQEEELSKEEKAILKKAIEIIKEKTNERIDWQAIFGKQAEEKDLLELMREASKPKEKDVYELIFEESEKQREEEKKKELSWEEKYRMYPSTKYWLDSLYESYGGGKTDAEKLEEQNDRLESLLEELRSERSSLEWDMMEYRWDLELAKPDPLDYKMALDLAISSTMMDIELGLYPWLTTPSYPGYSTQQNWTNYLWLYLLLNKK